MYPILEVLGPETTPFFLSRSERERRIQFTQFPRGVARPPPALFLARCVGWKWKKGAICEQMGWEGHAIREESSSSLSLYFAMTPTPKSCSFSLLRNFCPDYDEKERKTERGRERELLGDWSLHRVCIPLLNRGSFDCLLLGKITNLQLLSLCA